MKDRATFNALEIVYMIFFFFRIAYEDNTGGDFPL